VSGVDKFEGNMSFCLWKPPLSNLKWVLAFTRLRDFEGAVVSLADDSPKAVSTGNLPIGMALFKILVDLPILPALLLPCLQCLDTGLDA
jgi:hypothetical protein